MIRLNYLIDTNMLKITPQEQTIILLFLQHDSLASSAVFANLKQSGNTTSLVTVKRLLSTMVKKRLLETAGAGRSVAYHASTCGRLFADINAEQYCAIEPDQRYGLSQYNFALLPSLPADIFSADELEKLVAATDTYKVRTKDISATTQKKELERLVIELAWKSSKIEGNTYTLLDTEKLILENKSAPGHQKSEATMILNHKDAFMFIHQHALQFTTLTRANLEHVHGLLTNNLGVGAGLRKKPVGVTGSLYRPLDTIYQINEAVTALNTAISRAVTPYAKALLALVGISYIQPFEDGNKRTARLMANALLLAHGCAPLSYRSVTEDEYRAATLVFYELNSLVPFKHMFIEQYDFAARNYLVK